MNATPSSTRTPRWVHVVLCLQGATLLVALGLRPAVSAVEAGQPRMGQEEQRREPILPNAAGQRQEQIRLLKVIADQMTEMNAKLDQMNKSLDQQDDAQAQ